MGKVRDGFKGAKIMICCTLTTVPLLIPHDLLDIKARIKKLSCVAGLPGGGMASCTQSWGLSCILRKGGRLHGEKLTCPPAAVTPHLHLLF